MYGKSLRSLFRNVSPLISLGRNTSMVRVHRGIRSWAQYAEPPINFENVLFNGRGHYPQLFKKPSIDMTILRHAIQPEAELRQMMKCFGILKVQDQILFPPHRRSLQMTGALASMLVRTPPKALNFAKFVHDLHKEHILPMMPDVDIKFKREQYFNFIEEILADPTSKDQYPHVFEQFDRYMAEGHAQKERGLVDLTEEQLQELAVRVIVDKQIKKEMDEMLHGLVEFKIESLIDSGHLRSLHLMEPLKAQTIYEIASEQARYPRRMTTMLAGGPGSGKSISAENMALQLKEHLGIGLEDMAIINVDRIRTIFYSDDCVQEAGKKDFGTLTHDEAVQTFNMIRDFMLLRIAQHKKIPHCLQEMCNIWPQWIDFALKGHGNLIVTISTRMVGNAIQGVIARGIEQNEFITPPEYVLWSYKTVSERFPDVVQETQGKKVMMTLMNNEKAIQSKFRISSNCEEVDEQSKPFAIVDSETNTIYILDMKQYLDFINQSQVNTKARKSKEIYAGADLSIEASIARAIDPKRFGSTKIAFVRQDIDSTVISNLEKNIVLTVQEQQLEVLDPTYYDGLKQMVPEHVQALEAQTSHIRSLDL